MNSQNPPTCDVCGEGQLHSNNFNEEVSYKNKTESIFFHSSICDVCGGDYCDATQALYNKRAVIKFKKRVDEIPMGLEIVKMRKLHGITQECASRIFGGGSVTFSKYENDDVIPDEAMVTLIKLAIEYPDTIPRIAKLKRILIEQPVIFKEIRLSNEQSYPSLWAVEDFNPHQNHKQSSGEVTLDFEYNAYLNQSKEPAKLWSSKH